MHVQIDDGFSLTDLVAFLVEMDARNFISWVGQPRLNRHPLSQKVVHPQAQIFTDNSDTGAASHFPIGQSLNRFASKVPSHGTQRTTC
jgi:hypothetical protein